VLEPSANGFRAQDSADALGRSRRTVESRKYMLILGLGAATTLAQISRAKKRGLI
jgi:DNA-binding NarL/FixJ family response regulator